MKIKNTIDWGILKEYVSKHCTSGDEDDVVAMLRRCWQKHGWHVTALGHQALYAKPCHWEEGKPSVLICAHADVPGFIVQRTLTPKKGIAITLGGPHCECGKNAVQIKSMDGKIAAGTLEQKDGEYVVSSRSLIERGSRICWKAEYVEDSDFIQSPFLDNRVGCFLLHLLASSPSDCNVILAVTGTEECLGFGAAALARELKPDLVIILDATYVDATQNVNYGGGAVLTVCDKSIMIGNRQLKTLRHLCESWGIPLQYEIYNYAGTDAGAFTKGGHVCPVLPLLVATEGNHSRMEKAAKSDIEMTFALLEKLLSSSEAIEALNCSF